MAAYRSRETLTSDGRAKASTDQLPSLTSLRGLAALWVVLYHYSSQYFPNLDTDSYTHIISKGYLAVDMFFMLSGFVMTHVYHRAFSESIADNYKNFLVARIARLYPLHIFVLLLFVATAFSANVVTNATTGASHAIPAEGPRSFRALLANIFMLQGLEAGKLSWNYPSWSISVEFIAYLLFPFALPAIWRASNVTKLAFALSLAAALTVLALVTKDDFNQWDGPITLMRCLPEFLLGTLLYCAFRMQSQAQWLSRDAVAMSVLAALIVCLDVAAPDLLITLLFAGLILVAVSNTGFFAKTTNIGALVWLGEISYSLYLIHGFVQFAASRCLSAFGVQDRSDLPIGASLGLMLLMLGLCLFFATATYYGIEIVWRRHLRALFGSQRRQSPRLVETR